MDGLYFRNVLWVAVTGSLIWGWICETFYPGVNDSIAIRAQIAGPTFLGLVLSYFSKAAEKELERITYLVCFAITWHYIYICHFDPPDRLLVHLSGIYAVVTCCTFAIVSRKFLWFYTTLVLLFSVYKAWFNFAQPEIFLFWINIFTISTISTFFSFQRILNLEDLARSTTRMEALYSKARQVAHDIRSPVMALEMVRGSMSESDFKKKDIIQKALQRINDIADDLLQMHRRSQISKYVNDTVSVNEITKILIQEKAIANKNLKLNFAPQAENVDLLLPIKSSDLSRILSNIFNNSIEAFTNSEGVIRVRTYLENNSIVIAITDNGKGIPKDQLVQLFRKGSTFGKSNGNGLGLWGSKELLSKYKASINLESEESKGTTVRILLPCNSGNSK